MRKSSTLIASLVIALLFIPAFAQATSIFYSLADLGDDVWRYDYTIRNDSLGSAIGEFAIWFDYGLYEALVVESAKVDWFEQAFDPVWDATGPHDGFYNAIALAGGIAPGTEEAGFSISFLWLYDSAPPSFQRIDIIDNGQIIDQGQTQPMVSPVPEPGILALLSFSLAGLALPKAIGKVRS